LDVLGHVVEVNDLVVQRTKLVIERVWRAIQTQYFYPVPSPLNCPSCSFQAQCKAWTS
jgi:CRISPR/Cas system-associated exonuclease Cas4 (RecB family)